MQINILAHEIANYFKLCLAVSKAKLIEQHPDFAKDIEFLASKDPAGNLKYLEWELKVLQARKAMAPEIADVIELFHKHQSKLDKKDINQWTVEQFTELRDKLFALRDEQRAKQEEREQKKEKRYRVETDEVACGHKVIYESDRLRAIQITNKAASVHYGMGTKWCITMKDEHYFEDYDKNNVVFFFIFNKTLDKSNPYYKVAAAYQRDTNNAIVGVDWFDAKDNQIDSYTLPVGWADLNTNITEWDEVSESDAAKSYKGELNQIVNQMNNIAASYPKSLMARIYSGELKLPEVVQLYKAEKFPSVKTAIGIWLSGSKLDDPEVWKELAQNPDRQIQGNIAEHSSSPAALNEIAKNVKFGVSDLWMIAILGENPNLPSSAIEKILTSAPTLMKEKFADDDQSKLYLARLIRHQNISPQLLSIISKSEIGYFREAVARNKNTPGKILLDLSQDIDNVVKASAIANPSLTTDDLRLTKQYAKFKQWPKLSIPDMNSFLKNPNVPPELIKAEFERSNSGETRDLYALEKIAKNPNTPIEILGEIVKDMLTRPDFAIANALAKNPNLNTEMADALFTSHPRGPDHFGSYSMSDILNSGKVSPEAVLRLVQDGKDDRTGSYYVLLDVAANINTPKIALEELTKEPFHINIRRKAQETLDTLALLPSKKKSAAIRKKLLKRLGIMGSA